MGRQRKRGIRGAGSVFQRKDGRWEAKLKVEETGKYKSFYASTEKEAYQKLQEAQFKQKQGILVTGKDQTIKQFLEYWIEDVEKRMVRLSTYENNRVAIHKHLIPGIGHVKLQKLTAHQLQLFYTRKLGDGVSPSRIRRLNAVMRKALDHARRMKLVSVNVAIGLDLPKSERYEARFLTPEQANLLLRGAKEQGMEASIALAVITGMRRGEILALRWSDIDLDKRMLKVSRTLNYISHYGYVEGKPKTKSSERNIILPQVLVDILSLHYVVQQKERLESGSTWVDKDLVFADKSGGFILPLTLLRHFYRLLKKLGLPRMHFHDLRHSAATILLSMGVSPGAVQELLGHSSVTTTLGIYGHVLPSMRNDAVNKMDDLYRG